jgi:hypothetical protein
MDTKELITAAEAADMFSMSENAFRIFVYRNKDKVRVSRLGRRKVYYYRSNLLSLLHDDE